MSLLLVTFVVNFIYSVFGVSWTTSPDIMPVASSNMIVGYSPSTKKLWFLGGYDDLNDYDTSTSLMDFNITSETFTSHPSITSVKNITSNSQSFTQIGNILYMVTASTFATFNVITETFTPNWNNVIIPIDQTAEVPFGGCLANVGDRYLIVLGGIFEETYLDTMHIYDIYDGIWLSLDIITAPRRVFTCNVHNNYLYAIGGESCCPDSPVFTSSIEKIYVGNMSNIENENWVTLDDLRAATAYIRSVVINDDIYIIGGYKSNPLGYTSAVDIIKTSNNDQVTPDSNMNYAMASVTTVVADGRIYIMGGHDGGNNPTISPVNGVTNIWQKSSLIPTPSPTNEPTTLQPTTASPTTNEPTNELTTAITNEPTASPTTSQPTTANPTTATPSTAIPSTAIPSTAIPSTAIPTTAMPATAIPTTAMPTTAIPTTAMPTTAILTYNPIIKTSTVHVPTTYVPTTIAPSTDIPTTHIPTTDSLSINIPPSASATTYNPTSVTTSSTNSTLFGNGKKDDSSNDALWIIVIALLVTFAFILVFIGLVCYKTKAKKAKESMETLEVEMKPNAIERPPGSPKEYTKGGIDTFSNNNSKMNVDDNEVKIWLTSTVCLPKYYEMFMENGYETLDIIKEIQDKQEILEIGDILKGHATKIWTEINILKENIGINNEGINVKVNADPIDTGISQITPWSATNTTVGAGTDEFIVEEDDKYQTVGGSN